MILKIGFVKRPSGFVPLAWAIETLEHTSYSHVYMRYDDNGVDTVFQCNLGGTEPEPASSFFATYTLIEEFSFATDLDIETLRKFVEKYRGTPYSYVQLVSTSVYDTTGVKLSLLKLLIKGMVCSELVYHLLALMPKKFIGIESIGPDPKFVGLRSIHNFVSTHPGRVLSTFA